MYSRKAPTREEIQNTDYGHNTGVQSPHQLPLVGRGAGSFNGPADILDLFICIACFLLDVSHLGGMRQGGEADRGKKQGQDTQVTRRPVYGTGWIASICLVLLSALHTST